MCNSIQFQSWEPDSETETWRLAFETEFSSYILLHYKHGTCSVFSKKEGASTVITVCIEDHEFQAKNFWFVQLLIDTFTVHLDLNTQSLKIMFENYGFLNLKFCFSYKL